MDPTTPNAQTAAEAGDGDPLIVLIGGTAGCGKTTLANRLVGRFDLDHRLGTGFVRAVLQSQTTPAAEPELFARSYESGDPVAHVQAQARRLVPAVMACVARARHEGTSLVVEGTHLIPELYREVDARFLVLSMPDAADHLRRLVGHRHTRRRIATEDAARVRTIGQFYEREAVRLGVPLVRYEDNLDEVAEVLQLGVSK
jgi:2-phosphoglycerate kinase